MVATSASVNDGSSLNLVMPTLRSTCHGGICRLTTFTLMERAQGRASLYVNNDIGATAPGRWQFWQARSKMGAMALENVTSVSTAVASEGIRTTAKPANDNESVHRTAGFEKLRCNMVTSAVTE